MMTVPTLTGRQPAAARRPGLAAQLLRRKPIGQMVSEAENGQGGPKLVRSFGVLQLTMISVGATLGTGILVILGESVPLAGPAIWISFVIAGLAALLSAVSYAEMAGLVPVAGSSYSYTYATMGEGMAWICGWCLVLEYAVSVAAVAVGAGQYVNESLGVFGQVLPDSISQPPGDGGIMNIPAMVIVVLATILLVRGARESAWINTAIVVVKVGILLFFCAVAFTAFNAGNFEPLLPMGAAGVSAAASTVFFSYIGFDAASTAGEEARNPKRDLPRAIMLSMVIVTTIYVLVAVAAIGARPWGWFDGTEAALVKILEETTGQPWIALVFAVGAVLAIASIVLTVLYGQTRILLSMSRDGTDPQDLRPRLVPHRHTGCRDPDRGHRRRPHRRAGSARGTGGRHQHRHPVRLCPGQCCRHLPAPQPARAQAHLPRAAVPADPDPRRADVCVPHGQPWRRYLGGLRHLDAGGPRSLLRLRPAPLQGGGAQPRGIP